MKKFKKFSIFLLALSTVLMAAFVGYDRMNRDTQAPVITCPEETLEVSISVTEQELLEGVTVSDDQDAELTVVVEKCSPMTEEHTRTVTYAAADAAGNVSRATRTVHYTDYEPPRFRMDRPARVSGSEGIYTAISGLHAADVTGRDLTSRIRFDTLDNKMAYDTGDHLLELRVTDAFGFNEVLQISVDVFNPVEERMSVELKDYFIYLSAGASFDPQAYFEMPEMPGTLAVESNVDTSVPGSYTVDYTFTGETEDMVGRSRLIVIVEE